MNIIHFIRMFLHKLNLGGPPASKPSFLVQSTSPVPPRWRKIRFLSPQNFAEYFGQFEAREHNVRAFFYLHSPQFWIDPTQPPLNFWKKYPTMSSAKLLHVFGKYNYSNWILIFNIGRSSKVFQLFYNMAKNHWKPIWKQL